MSEIAVPVAIPRFDRTFFASDAVCSRIGGGEIGGKAGGLVQIRDVLAARFAAGCYEEIEVGIPRMVVLGTEVFTAFVRQNGLVAEELAQLRDHRIAQRFHQADFPVEYVGDLRALVAEVHSPLAVRSSSLLEDALFRPFAGVYATKMTPNNQPDPDTRFRKLVEAVKYVYASTFFREARAYRRLAAPEAVERMAVIIQEVVGRRHRERFYPDIAGVARSYNFYPVGAARPEEGVASLALGLGKTIVDGGLCWTWSPAHPKAPPPFGSTAEMLRDTQHRFWAVNMGPPPAYDPLAETEYLVECDLSAAEEDDTLRALASTYDPASDRIEPGTERPGPRVLNFPLPLQLREPPLNDLLRELLTSCAEAWGNPVEIEFACALPPGGPPRFAFLQVRPMVVSSEKVDIDPARLAAPDVLVASERVMGNGATDAIRDIVYVRPETFAAEATRRVASDLEALNETLLGEERPYLLIGFGRWGSSDPWLGIPVQWGQICAARSIVEATLPEMNVEASQGTHFFHNLSSFQVSYFTVHHHDRQGIDWSWLAAQPALHETALVRHLRLEVPLRIRVDGRSGRGAIWHG